MNSIPINVIPQTYKLYNVSQLDIATCSNEPNNWNYWILLFITFGVLFFTPLWSFLLIYSHLPFAIVYYIALKIAKSFQINFDNYDQWQAIRSLIAIIWCNIGKYWHGYTIKGLENIPDHGPALLVFYHGAFALDAYFLCATSMRLKLKGRFLRVVLHRSFARLKGWPFFQRIVNVVPGTAECCINALRNGDMILVAPGGSLEALLSDHESYKLYWKNKLGFARVAIQARVPIIPVFTENLREAYRVPSLLRSIFIYLHNKLPYPIPPAYGGFPVKLTTHIGKPILFDSSYTPEQFAEKTLKAMTELIKQNQRIPGSIWLGIKDKWTKNKCEVEQ